MYLTDVSMQLVSMLFVLIIVLYFFDTCFLSFLIRMRKNEGQVRRQCTI